MSTLRFGICGLGFMGREHLRRLHDHPRARVIAVCDADSARCAGNWGGPGNLDYGKGLDGKTLLEGVRTYEMPQELIADADVDVVLVALPTVLHTSVTIAAVEAGKHVLVEKPMALNVADCNRMISAAETANRVLMVAQCIRFWPQYVKIKELLAAGNIGAPRAVHLRRLGSPPSHSANNWMLRGPESGGAFLDLHVHDVDFAHHLLGLPDGVYARGRHGVSGEVDHIVATYSYADGRYAVIEGGWLSASGWPFEMSILVQGERGVLEWSLGRGPEVILYRTAGEPERITCAGDALQNQVDYFVDCVLGGQPVAQCAPRSTRHSVALAWLEHRSIEIGKVVSLTERLKQSWDDGGEE